MKKKYRFVFFIILILFFSSCCGVLSSQNNLHKEIAILSYNVQTLFDTKTCGTEYAEYRSASSKWSKAKYDARVSAVANVLQDSYENSPSIVVLQEIENANVLYDIASRFSYKNRYEYGVALPNNNQALTVGILSRFPIIKIIAHQVYSEDTIDTTGKNILRPLLEVHFMIQGEELVIIACHWKSKKDGDGTDKILRNLQAKKASTRIKELQKDNPELPIMLIGDFNEELSDKNTMLLLNEKIENLILQNENTNLAPILIANNFSDMKKNIKNNNSILMFEPWYLLEKEKRGSYYFKENWNMLDHALCSSGLFNNVGLELKNFYKVNLDYLLTEDDTPFRYDVFSGKGFSDHLPILTVLSVS